MSVVIDRHAWLDEWCPYCWAAPGSRCRQHRYLSRKRPSPTLTMHVARGWRERACPTCKGLSGEPCHTPSAREASRPHVARLHPGRGELTARQAVWQELERRGAMIAVVPFSGRVGDGGRTGTIPLSRVEGDELVDVERWGGRDELALALEGPVWGLGKNGTGISAKPLHPDLDLRRVHSRLPIRTGWFSRPSRRRGCGRATHDGVRCSRLQGLRGRAAAGRARDG